MSTPSSETSETVPAACPSNERLRALLDGGDDQEVALHLETCEACRERLARLAGGGEWLDPLLHRDASAGAAAEPELRGVLDAMRHAAPHHQQTQSVFQPPLPAELGFLGPASSPGYIGRLGPYNVIELVGQGGMGIVLKAHDPSLDRVVAIKVLAPALAASPDARRRFVREARAAAAVSHEHVVTIHAVDESGPLPYLVMQFVCGRSLEKRIRDSGPLKPEEILRIGMQTASGLAAAHAQGLVHRDIKPANIMLENGVERVRITDFGLARAADDAAVTATGQVTGTPMYMSPEQARGERVDHRGDLFSLGAVMYAMCTGQPPFAAANPLTSLRKVCEEEPRAIERVNDGIPSWLGDVVRRLMHKDPGQRPQTAAGVADELARHLARLQNSAHRSASGPDAEADAATERRQPRRRGLALFAAGALAVAAVVLVVTETRGITRLSAWITSDRDGAPIPQTGTQPGASRQAAGYEQPLAGARPFAVIPADPNQRRSYATLGQAIAAAAPGDVVEIRRDGRFEVPRVDIGTKPLILRAAEGVAPVLVQAKANQPILTTAASLVLEGLSFDGAGGGSDDPPPGGIEPGESLVVAAGDGVYVLNCRFVVRATADARFGCIRLASVRACEIRNTELHALRASCIHWFPSEEGDCTLRLHNTVSAGRLMVAVRNHGEGKATFEADGCTVFCLWSVGLLPGARPQHLSVELLRSVFVTKILRLDMRNMFGAAAMNAIAWKESRCVFDIGRLTPSDLAPAPAGTAPPQADPAEASPSPTETPRANRGDSLDADVRFRGELRAKNMRGEAPVAEDFALQSVRPQGGRRAPPRLINSVGIQPELTGPGTVYDAVRRSSAYLVWQQQVEKAVRPAR